MKLHPSIIILFLLINSCSQNKSHELPLKTEQEKHLENELIQYFQHIDYSDKKVTKDSLFYTDYKDGNNFNLSIYEPLSHFNVKHFSLSNPYYNKKYEHSENEKTQVKNYPKSYSVIYFDHLISLFENGKFACFNLKNFERNHDFETKINTQKMDYHWVINGIFTAQKGNSFFTWEDSKWTKINKKYPFKNRPILYSDNDYIVFNECFGEWGGTIYFFEIQTNKIFFTEATCANTVWKTDEGFHVLSSLMHGSGSSQIKLIENPKRLPEISAENIDLTVNGEAVGYTDQSNSTKIVLDIYNGMLNGRINLNNEDIYLGEIEDLFFFSKVNGNQVQIIYPFFREDFFSNDPITQKYGSYYLMNQTFYGKGLDREVGMLLFKNHDLIKIEWSN